MKSNRDKNAHAMAITKTARVNKDSDKAKRKFEQGKGNKPISKIKKKK